MQTVAMPYCTPSWQILSTSFQVETALSSVWSTWENTVFLSMVRLLSVWYFYGKHSKAGPGMQDAFKPIGAWVYNK